MRYHRDLRANTLRSAINCISSMLQDQYLCTDREMCDKVLAICEEVRNKDDALPSGYNNSVRQAQEALRYLANNPRPNGGEERYNAAHLLQIADELAK